jgi:hypothetical protein
MVFTETQLPNPINIWASDGESNDGTAFRHGVIRHDDNTDDGIWMFRSGVEQTIIFGDDAPPNDPIPFAFNDDLNMTGTNQGSANPFGIASTQWPDNAPDGNDGDVDELWIRNGLASDDWISTEYENLMDNAAFWVVSPTIKVGDVPVGATSGSAIK